MRFRCLPICRVLRSGAFAQARQHKLTLIYHKLPVELRTSLVNTAAHEYFSDLGKS